MEKQILVKCTQDNKFEQERRIVHSCNNEFKLEKENIFYVESLGYFDDVIGQYYTICPNCGYIVMLDKQMLPDDLKLIAEVTNKEDPLLYKKNNLKSELIYLESITPKVRTRVLF